MNLGNFNKNKRTDEGNVKCHVCGEEYFWNENAQNTYIATQGCIKEINNSDFREFILYSPCNHCENNNIHTIFINKDDVKK